MKRLLVSFCIVASLLLVSYSAYQYTQALSHSTEQASLKLAEEQRIQKENQHQIECLADNIYHESRGESYDGKIAVAFVTINRTLAEKFPDNICGVVKQKTNKVCQFSWYCESEKKAQAQQTLLTKTKDMSYNEVKRIAEFVYNNYTTIKDPTKGALFYHANYVNPKWKNLKKTAKIGNHIFYTMST